MGKEKEKTSELGYGKIVFIYCKKKKKIKIIQKLIKTDDYWRLQNENKRGNWRKN